MAQTIISLGQVDDNLAVTYESGEILNVTIVDTIMEGATMATRIVVGTVLNLDGEATENIAEIYSLVRL